jgi:RNA polymerase sigma factor (sigma-70 family)
MGTEHGTRFGAFQIFRPLTSFWDGGMATELITPRKLVAARGKRSAAPALFLNDRLVYGKWGNPKSMLCTDRDRNRSILDQERFVHIPELDRKGFPKQPSCFVLSDLQIEQFWNFKKLAVKAGRKVAREFPPKIYVKRCSTSRHFSGPGYEDRHLYRIFAGPEEDLIQECYLAVMESLESYDYPPEDAIYGAARDAARLDHSEYHIDRSCAACGGTGLAHGHSNQPCPKCRKHYGVDGAGKRKGAGRVFVWMRATQPGDSEQNGTGDDGWVYSDRDEFAEARWWRELFADRDSYPEPGSFFERTARMFCRDSSRRAVAWAVGQLPILEGAVIQQRYLSDEKPDQADVARELRISQGSVSRIERRALELLQQNLPPAIVEPEQRRWRYSGKRVALPLEIPKRRSLPRTDESIVLRSWSSVFRRHMLRDSGRAIRDFGTRPRGGRALSFGGFLLDVRATSVLDFDNRRVAYVAQGDGIFTLRLKCGHEIARQAGTVVEAICYECRAGRVAQKVPICGGHRIGEVICDDCERLLTERSRHRENITQSLGGDDRKLPSIEMRSGLQPIESAMNEMEKIESLESDT